MKNRRFRRGCLAVASLVALSALPREGHAQAACRAGPLSAFLQSSGMGCSIGNARLGQFTAQGVGDAASSVWLDPFTVQGPPGYTWVGFHVRFSSGGSLVSKAPLGLSFWADGVPLHGVMGVNAFASGSPGASMERGTTVTLTGDGGTRQAVDRTEQLRKGNSLRLLRGCGWVSGRARSCLAGDSTATGGPLADADLRYQVAVRSMYDDRAGQPSDHTVALLVESQAVVTPEPAAMLLFGSGLAGVGAVVRRRRSS